MGEFVHFHKDIAGSCIQGLYPSDYSPAGWTKGECSRRRRRMQEWQLFHRGEGEFCSEENYIKGTFSEQWGWKKGGCGTPEEEVWHRYWTSGCEEGKYAFDMSAHGWTKGKCPSRRR